MEIGKFKKKNISLVEYPCWVIPLIALGKLPFLKYHWFFYIWLVVSTHLKNTSQNGNLPQIGVKIQNIWNHHLDIKSRHQTNLLALGCWNFVRPRHSRNKWTLAMQQTTSRDEIRWLTNRVGVFLPPLPRGVQWLWGSKCLFGFGLLFHKRALQPNKD